MSKNRPTLSEERQKEVFSEFVDMYIKNGGTYPTARDIKNNPYITEEEVAIMRKHHQIEDNLVRYAAKEKTGRVFPSQSEREKQQRIAGGKAKAAANTEKTTANQITEGLLRAAKRAEQTVGEKKKEVNTVQKTEKEKKSKAPVRRINEEAVKKALHDFAVENLRWPTGAEMVQFYKEKRPGWEASRQWINFKLGTSDDW